MINIKFSKELSVIMNNPNVKNYSKKKEKLKIEWETPIQSNKLFKIKPRLTISKMFKFINDGNTI